MPNAQTPGTPPASGQPTYTATTGFQPPQSAWAPKSKRSERRVAGDCPSQHSLFINGK